MRAWALVLLAGCDPAAPKPVAPIAVFSLTAKVSDSDSGKVFERAWTVSAAEIADPAPPLGGIPFNTARDRFVIEVRSTRAVSPVYKIATDGKRFAVLKGGVPVRELRSADEGKALEEALDLLRLLAARDLAGR